MDLIARVILFNHLIAQREGLGSSDGQFLQLLRLHGPMTAGQLAAMTGLTTGSTTGVIDRLEQAGFAHRTRDPADRRKVVVVPDHEAIGTRLAPHYTGQADRLDRVLGTRSVEELRAIADFLAELTSGPIAP